MPTVSSRLAHIGGEPPDAVSRIAAAALRWAEPTEREPLASAALESRRPDAIAAVIAALHLLGSAAMATLADPRTPVEPALRLLRTRQQLLNGVAVARRRTDARLLAFLVECLGSPHDDVPQHAAAALLAVVTANAGRDGRRLMTAETAAQIDAAVTAAVSTGRRHPDAVFLAVAIMASRPGSGLASVLRDSQHPALFSIRRVVGRTDNPLVRHNLLRWLTTDALGAQAQRSLHRVHGAGEYAELLDAGHLLLQPARRRALRRVDRRSRCLPDYQTASALPADAQVDLVRLVRALPTTAALRRERLADCTALSSPTARLSGVIGLLSDDSAAAQQAIMATCLDRDEAVACLAAARVLAAPDPPAAHFLRTLESSPHPLIARRATLAAAACSVDAFFERWLSLRAQDRIAISRGFLHPYRPRLLARLRAALCDGTKYEKLAAISVAGRLGLGGDLDFAIIGLIGDSDSRVASAAVPLLAVGRPRHCLKTMRAALNHHDARVRANALETLTRIDRRAIDRLHDLLVGGDNRLRANAIRALLRRGNPKGPSVLGAMLRDPDPRHRVSAIWVAARAREGRVVGVLARIADQDQVGEVRRRAAAAVQWIGS